MRVFSNFFCFVLMSGRTFTQSLWLIVLQEDKLASKIADLAVMFKRAFSQYWNDLRIETLDFQPKTVTTYLNSIGNTLSFEGKEGYFYIMDSAGKTMLPGLTRSNTVNDVNSLNSGICSFCFFTNKELIQKKFIKI